MRNELCNGSFPVNAQIQSELIGEEIKFVMLCFVDIVLILRVMCHFCCLLHGKQCMLDQILARDQERSSLQGFNYISKFVR